MMASIFEGKANNKGTDHADRFTRGLFWGMATLVCSSNTCMVSLVDIPPLGKGWLVGKCCALQQRLINAL